MQLNSMISWRENELFSGKIDPRLQSIMSSPYVQQHLQLAGLV